MSYTVPAILEKVNPSPARCCPDATGLQITNSDADLRIVATGDLKKGLENGSIRLDGDQVSTCRMSPLTARAPADLSPASTLPSLTCC